MTSDLAAWAPFIPIVWIIGWITASVLYRRSAGKPIWARLPGQARFKERAASGWGDNSLFGRMGGARNCLMVAVTDQEIVVTPFSPFTLLFMPEMFGLEMRAPLSQVRLIERRSRFLREAVIVELWNDKRLGLYLFKPDAFEAALRLGGVRAA